MTLYKRKCNILFYYKIILKIYLSNFSNISKSGFVILMARKMKYFIKIIVGTSHFVHFLTIRNFFLFVFWAYIVVHFENVYTKNWDEKSIGPYIPMLRNLISRLIEILMIKKTSKTLELNNINDIVVLTIKWNII